MQKKKTPCSQSVQQKMILRLSLVQFFSAFHHSVHGSNNQARTKIPRKTPVRSWWTFFFRWNVPARRLVFKNHGVAFEMQEARAPEDFNVVNLRVLLMVQKS